MFKNWKRKLSTILTALMMALIPIMGLAPKVNAEDTMKIGDYVQFGSYNKESILWRIINIDEEGNPLLFAESILCLKEFDSHGKKHSEDAVLKNPYGDILESRRLDGSNEWENSNIRQWLSSEEKKINWIQNEPSYCKESGFLADGNFSAEERAVIKPVNHKVLLAEIDKEKKQGGKGETWDYVFDIKNLVENYDSSYYKNVTDKVFLLSGKELKEYVYDRGWEFKTKPTAKAVKDNSNASPYYSYSYYLRNPAAYFVISCVRIVNCAEDGFTIETGRANNNIGGIRPALYLNMSSAAFKSGAGTKAKPYVLSAETEAANKDKADSKEPKDKDKDKEKTDKKDASKSELNLTVNVKSSHSAVMTISGIEVPKEFEAEYKGYEEHGIPYFWTIFFGDYGVDLMYYPEEISEYIKKTGKTKISFEELRPTIISVTRDGENISFSEIDESHNGSVKVTSKENSLTFDFTFPKSCNIDLNKIEEYMVEVGNLGDYKAETFTDDCRIKN
jgi:hypothetical protein